MATNLNKAQEAMRTCDEHEHEELSCFCKMCEKFICMKCAKTEHHGHDWDFVSLMAKKRRKEMPILCRKIKKENMPRCREKLRVIDDNISAVEKASDDDVKKLEERRNAMISVINRIFDEKKRKREGCTMEESRKFKEQNHQLLTKIEYLDKMTSSLDGNIRAYNDYDIIVMELDMLSVLREVESQDVDRSTSIVKFVPGEINEGELENMVGSIEETTKPSVDDTVIAEEIKSFKEFDDGICTIYPVSKTKAWISNVSDDNIKLLSLQNKETQSIKLPHHADFVTLSNDDFIVINSGGGVLLRVTLDGKVSDIVSTKPLYPTSISKTHTDDLLVTLRDAGNDYKLKPSSRRLVQRMALTGKILNTYEFREDGTTRLFTFPELTAENGNTDICVINETGDETGELIVLYRHGQVNFTYRGQDSEFCPTAVACDSKTRIVVLDYYNGRFDLLNPDGAFLRYLLSDKFEGVADIALHQDNLWIGFDDGAVKVYKYNF